MHYIGLDIGGTKIYGGVIDQKTYKIEKVTRVPTQITKSKPAIIAQIQGVVASLLTKNTAGIGIGIAGQVDFRKGFLIRCPNIPALSSVKLGPILRNKFQIPVALENDARCFTLGEAYFGVGKKYRHLVGITLGTGIGAGIIIDRRLYRGAHNIAGEVGHITISDHNILCSCGGIGHFEALASGSALITQLSRLTNIPVSAESALKLLNENNPLAVQAAEVIVKNTSMGLANLINILNPEAIILGGGLIKLKYLRQNLRKTLSSALTFQKTKKTKLLFTKLGENANILGAVKILEEVHWARQAAPLH